ncbi:MAG: GntR family transcriptional regulator [Anaerolineaceae bacterium]|nr:GntR family transcriptional regulator [Anaerolineaceae bacterium]
MDTNYSIDQKSSEPLYLQLKKKLIEGIISGVYKPGEKLPSERILSEELKISRMTVREALKILNNDGYIYTQVGKGTFVQDILYKQDTVLTGFTEQMHKINHEVSSKVLEFSLQKVQPNVITMLEIGPNDLAYKLKRIRYANKKVLAIETAYIPSDLCIGLEKHDFSKESLYSVLRDDYGLKLVLAEQTVIASLAEDDEYRLFDIQSPDAVLRIKRLTKTNLKQPIEYVESVYRGDSYILHTQLSCENDQ